MIYSYPYPIRENGNIKCCRLDNPIMSSKSFQFGGDVITNTWTLTINNSVLLGNTGDATPEFVAGLRLQSLPNETIVGNLIYLPRCFGFGTYNVALKSSNFGESAESDLNVLIGDFEMDGEVEIPEFISTEKNTVIKIKDGEVITGNHYIIKFTRKDGASHYLRSLRTISGLEIFPNIGGTRVYPFASAINLSVGRNRVKDPLYQDVEINPMDGKVTVEGMFWEVDEVHNFNGPMDINNVTVNYGDGTTIININELGYLTLNNETEFVRVRLRLDNTIEDKSTLREDEELVEGTLEVIYAPASPWEKRYVRSDVTLGKHLGFSRVYKNYYPSSNKIYFVDKPTEKVYLDK